jgi:hypothetical protein
MVSASGVRIVAVKLERMSFAPVRDELRFNVSDDGCCPVGGNLRP